MTNAWALLQQLLAPPPAPTALLLGGLAAVAALAALRPRSLWCLPWLAALLLPGTTHVVLKDGELAGRFVFDAVPGLALFVGLALAAPAARRGRLRTGLAALAAIAVLAALALGSRAWLRRYGDEDATIRAAGRALLAAAEDAGPGRPFGVAGLPGLPLLQPALWGFLAQRPFAARDLPVVGLANMLARNPAAPSVFGDATAAHALVVDGAGAATWDPPSRTLKPIAKAPPGSVEFVPDPGDPRRFLPPRLLPPTAVAAFEVALPEPAAAAVAWRAEILGNLEGEYAASPLTGETAAGARSAWLPAAHVLPWLVAGTFGGGPAGIALTGNGAPPPPGTRVLARNDGPRLPSPRGDRAVAEPVDRRVFAALVARPDGGVAGELHVLLPTGLFAMALPAGGAVELTAEIRGELAFVCDLLGPCRVHWFVCEAQRSGSAGPPRRSTFGSCLVR